MRWDEATFWATSISYYYRARSGWVKANTPPGQRHVSTSDAKRLKALMADNPASI